MEECVLEEQDDEDEDEEADRVIWSCKKNKAAKDCSFKEIPNWHDYFAVSHSDKNKTKFRSKYSERGEWLVVLT